jgi:transposase
MDLLKYEELIGSEEAARAYFLSICWPDGEVHCPRCHSERIYQLAGGRLRCGGCRYTFHEFSRRWINMGGLTTRDWLRILKLFELEQTASSIADQTRLAYNTVYKALTTLRFAILSRSLDAGELLGPSLGPQLGFANGKINMRKADAPLRPIPVFGIIEKEGWAFIDYLPYMHAETVFHFNFNFSLQMNRMGNLVYTDRYQDYDALIFCGDESLPYRYIKNTTRTPYVDQLSSRFWRFVRPRMLRYNGVSPRRFPLYLKELEFRYNRRGQPMTPDLAESLCGLVPEDA